jgi:hypothetical protein
MDDGTISWAELQRLLAAADNRGGSEEEGQADGPDGQDSEARLADFKRQARPRPPRGTRRVQLVRRDGRDVSSQYGREGGRGGGDARAAPSPRAHSPGAARGTLRGPRARRGAPRAPPDTVRRAHRWSARGR